MKILRLLGVVTLLGLLLAPSAWAERPNLILLNIDDLGYGDTGPYGSKINRTPNLDRMTAEGRKLTSHYAAPVCSPSRAALMTGCYPKRALPIPHVLFPAAAVGLNPDEQTIAELLKKAGYATACIGKWHLGDQPEFLPTRQGFDHYYGIPYSNDMGPPEDGAKSNPGHPHPQRKGKGKQSKQTETGITGLDQPPLPLLEDETVIQRVRADDQATITRRYTERAVHFIRENKDRPFFLYLPHSAVHFPHYPGKRFRHESPNDLLGNWVEEVDWSVGQILDTLRDLDLQENTLVIFTSDNGGPVNQGAHNTPLRGSKGSTLEGGIRTCTIAWWPGKVPAGTSTDAITSMMDILPTFVSLGGGTLPADRKLDGVDITSVLTGSESADAPRDTFHYFRGLTLEAVRSGPWKLHLGKGQLYNLAQDIGEEHDVSADHPQVVARLRALAMEMDSDLGLDGKGPGCRPLGRVSDPQPLIADDGTIRKGFEPR
ncbi:MAG TPA: sulfatase [Isosphaeraceae bacterium]|nr:sulfatase [Isosphaeraceae bacterium]